MKLAAKILGGIGYLPQMNFKNLLPPVFASLAVIAVGFVAISIFDIIIAVLNARFYSKAAFIIIFGVGGIFAGLMAYTYAIETVKQKNESARWIIIGCIILAGLFFFFFLARIEGGEYEAAFKSYGITTSLSCLLMARGKVD